VGDDVAIETALKAARALGASDPVDAAELAATAASRRANDRFPGYAASKAAEWSLTNALRIGLRELGPVVVGVYVGYVDTGATKKLDVPKVSAAEVAEKTMEIGAPSAS
jgi:NAD(P)-dependent dehydrogenase (short-subunit alcohol dehydrogenase family)